MHKDFREGNVLWDFKSERVVLIDFAGRENEVVYPPLMNNAILWPEGAESGKPLCVKHDDYWFKKFMERVDASRGSM